MAGQNILNAVFAASLVIALGSNCLLGQPFFFRKDILLAENPVSVVPADLNGDGGFLPGPAYPSEIEELFTFPIAAADFASDGYAELVARNLVHPNLVSIFPGSPNGMLQLPSEHAVGWLGAPPFLDPFWAQPSPPHSVWSPVDVDGDGRLDLVTTNYSSNSVSILMPRDQGGPELRRAVSAADYAAVVAPGSLATLFVPTMATSSTSASPPWPTDLGDRGRQHGCRHRRDQIVHAVTRG